jgi:redox-sensing transcriptional repressor
VPSEKTIGRLSLYRSLLNRLLRQDVKTVYSYELAAMAGGTASQVRRDLMAIGATGSPNRGYEVERLIANIGAVLDATEPEGVALVGVGNLGGALLAFFANRRPMLRIVAGFDTDPFKVNRVLHGVRCHPMADLERVIQEQSIRVGVITVPAGEAQEVADRLIRAGAYGLLNFAPVRLRVPTGIHVEDVDVAMSLEKVAYFARQNSR